MLVLTDIPTWLLLIGGIILLVFWYSSIKLSHFKKLGIPGPKPFPILCNALELMFLDEGPLHLKYKREHGPVVGMYTGFLPSMLIFDQEMISQVMVKQFDNFTNREFLTINEFSSEMLAGLTDHNWKFVRSRLTASFTPSKLRQMFGELNRCSTKLAENFASSVEQFELKEIVRGYTMDFTTSFVCGLRMDSQDAQNLQNNPFIVNGMNMLNFLIKSHYAAMSDKSYVIPAMSGVFQRIHHWCSYDTNSEEFFVNVFKQALDAQNQTDECMSFIQLMVNSKHGSKLYSKDEKENLGTNTTKTGITETQVFANAVLLIVSGCFAAGGALTMLLYCLANNLDCQEKLIQEIDSVIGDEENVSYDNLKQMHYLDQCMYESLRLFPESKNVSRVTKENIDINGVSFKKGTIVRIPTYALQNDPEIWTDPERFDPERFSSEEKAKRHPILCQPFGFGPRQCIGMKLATYILKAAVVHILRKQIITLCEKTEQAEKGEPKGGIWLASNERK